MQKITQDFYKFPIIINSFKRKEFNPISVISLIHLIVVFTFLLFSSSAHSQCTINTINADFEWPVVSGAGNYINQSSYDASQLGWKTTASDGNLEFWHNGNYQNRTAYSGNQFVELNATMPSGLYQDYDTSIATYFNYSFAHTGRLGTDSMVLKAGPPGGPYTVITNATTGNTAWVLYTGTYKVPAGQIKTRFVFEALSTFSGDLSTGNFLDAINFTATIDPPTIPDTQSSTISNTIQRTICSGNATTFTIPATTGTTIYWYDSQNNFISEGNSFSTPVLVTNATYKVKQRNISNCESSLLDILIEVTNKPTIPNITAPAQVCSNSVLSLTTPNVAANGAPIIEEGWYLDNKPFTSTTNVTYADNGKALTYKAKNSCGETVSNSVAIKIEAAGSCAPILNVDVKSLSPVVCNITDEIVSYEVTITNSGATIANSVVLDFVFSRGIVFDSAVATYSNNATGPTGFLTYTNRAINPLIGKFDIPPTGTVTFLLKGKINGTPIITPGTYNVYGGVTYTDPTNQNLRITPLINYFSGNTSYSSGGNVPGSNFDGDKNRSSDVIIKALPTAAISYSAASYSTTEGIINVNRTGTPSGTYTSTPAGLNIDQNTGAINPAASAENSYTITYTFTDGNCSNTAQTNIKIDTPKIAAWLAVTDENNNGIVEPGETLTFILRLSNIDPNHTTLKSVTGSIDLPAHTTLVNGGSVTPSKISFSDPTITDFPYSWDLSYQREPAIVMRVKADCDLTGVTQIETIGRIYIDGVEIKISVPPIPLSATGTWVTITGSNQHLNPPSLQNCTDPNGCPSALPVSSTKVTILNITNPPLICSSSAIDLSTTINADKTPGTITYWRDAAATISLVNPTAVSVSGTYYIKNTSVNGCLIIKPVVVTVQDKPTIPTINNTPATCSEASIHEISNYAATNVYTFSPAGPSVDSNGIVSAMTAGTPYTVTSKNADCISVPSAEFTHNEQLVTAEVPTINNTPATCSEASIHEISNYAATNVYTFSPAGPSVDSNGIVSAMTAGTPYTVTSKNADCISVPSAEFTHNEQLVTAEVPTINNTPATCSEASIHEISNYAATNVYTFSPAGPSVDSNGIVSAMTAGTPYTVTSKNADCISVPSAEFTHNEQLVTAEVPTINNTPATCSEASIHEISNYAATNVYTFSPAGPSVDSNGIVSAMTAGTPYTVTSKNADCISVPSAEFTHNEQLVTAEVPTINNTPATCSEASIHEISNYAATNVYTFSPAGPSVDSNGIVSAMTAGTPYTVTSKNADCISVPSAEFTHNEQLVTAEVPTINNTPATCSEASIHEISNYAATNVYTFSPAGPSVDSNGIVSAMTAGTPYTVTSKNADCISVPSAEFTHNEQLHAPLEPILSAITQPTCDTATGTFIIENYSADYTYTIIPSTGTSLNGNTITAPQGEYQLTAQSGNCTSELSEKVFIYNPIILESQLAENSILPEICAGDKDGSFKIEIKGGTQPYYVSLNDKNGTYDKVTGTEYNFINLTGGSHIVYTKDVNGCTTELKVKMPDATVINPIAKINYACVNNVAENTVTINIDSSIKNPADVDYSLDGGDYQSENIFKNIAPGTHTITARHTNGCEQTTSSFIIDNVHPLTIDLADGDLNEIVATATGGSTIYHYTFEGESNNTLNKLIIYKSGIYTVNVTDSNGCTASISKYFEYIDVCISNYFTPNGDGVNDEWGPDCTENYKNLSYTIFDRYGRVIGKYKVGQKWDGKYNGAELPSGDYWYVLKLNDPRDSREFVGHFTLYR